MASPPSFSGHNGIQYLRVAMERWKLAKRMTEQNGKSNLLSVEM